MESKAIVITGANGNVGSYMAEKYLKVGENLILCIHKDEFRLKTLLRDYPEQTAICRADISDINTLQINLEKIIQSKKWHPKALIHTISKRSSDFQPLINTDPELWKRIVDVNLNGTYNILKILIPYFKKEQYGKIILFGSNVTRIGLARGSAYSASKAGLLAYINVLREELRGENIKIVNILPGATRTPIWPAESLAKHANKMMSPRDIAKFIFEIYKLKSNMVPEEIVLRPLEGDI